MTDAANIRAVRNNNPGNIRVGTPWQGLMLRAHMTPVQAAETAFCVFSSPAMGFRAMATIFHTYFTKDMDTAGKKITTIRQAIGRWAPPNENNTDAYVKAVCDYTACGPDEGFPYGDPAHMTALLKGVSIHECGGWFFQPNDLLAGVQAASAG